MNYEADIRIDETALDLEWLEQPRLMMKYTQHAAEMRQNMDEAKEALDLVRAELDRDIRSDPDKYDVGKVTNDAINSVILDLPEYKEANNEYLEAKFENEVAQGAVRAFDQRKTALENLVRLHGQQYFAGPRVPRDLSKEVEKRRDQDKVNEGIGKKMRRNK